MSSSILVRWNSRLWPVLALLACLSAPLWSAAPVPTLLNYQGQLTDNLGNALNGTYPMTFSLYNDPLAGTQVWTETQAAVVVTKGLFNVILGSVAAINLPAANVNDNLWLAVRVAPDATDMSPRHQILPAAYAWNARSVWGYVPGTGANNLALLDGAGHLAGSTQTVPLDLIGNLIGDVASAQNTSVFSTAKGFYAAGYTGLSATTNSVLGTAIYGNTLPTDSAVSKAVWGQALNGAGVVGNSVNGVGVSATSASYFGGPALWANSGSSDAIRAIASGGANGNYVIGVNATGYYGGQFASNYTYGFGVYASGYIGVYGYGTQNNFYSDIDGTQTGYYGYDENGTGVVADFSSEGGPVLRLYTYNSPDAVVTQAGNGPAIQVTSTAPSGAAAISISAQSGGGLAAWANTANSISNTAVYGFGYHGVVGVGAYISDDTATGVSGTTDNHTWGTGVYAAGYWGEKISAYWMGLVIGGENYYGGSYLQSPYTAITASAIQDAIDIPSAGIYGLNIMSAPTGVKINATGTGANIYSSGVGISLTSQLNGINVQVNANGFNGVNISSTAAGVTALSYNSYWGFNGNSYYGIGTLNNYGNYYGLQIYQRNTANSYPGIFSQNMSTAGTAVYAYNSAAVSGNSGSALQVYGRMKVSSGNAGVHSDGAVTTTHSHYCAPCYTGDIAIVTPTSSNNGAGWWYVSGPDSTGYIYVYTQNSCLFPYNYMIIAK